MIRFFGMFDARETAKFQTSCACLYACVFVCVRVSVRACKRASVHAFACARESVCVYLI